MITDSTFQSGNNQASRIPNEKQTSENGFWALLRQSINQADEDFSFDRNQPSLNDLPAREAL
ncbi:MAG: hypothetical protein IJV40_16755 [Oscillospiraceae bacterium]|nr:hypothetical protein [Oscillospiraceae bacterium]